MRFGGLQSCLAANRGLGQGLGPLLLSVLSLLPACGPSSAVDRTLLVRDAARTDARDTRPPLAGGASGTGGTGGSGGQGGNLDGSSYDGDEDLSGAADGGDPGDGLVDPDAGADGEGQTSPVVDAADEALPPRPDADQAPPQLSRGRVGHWKLDEGRGNVGIDSSGIGNHGGTVNILGPDWRNGKIGTALIFTPPRRTFLIVASHPTLGPTDAMSISVWVNAASWSASPRILQKGDDDIQYGLRAEAEQLRFVLRLDSGVAMVSTPVPATGKFVHIGATYDGRELRLYLDGSPVAMATGIGKIASPFTALTIGARSQSAPESDFFNGLIDDVIIYERALSAAEVRLLSEPRSP